MKSLRFLAALALTLPQVILANPVPQESDPSQTDERQSTHVLSSPDTGDGRILAEVTAAGDSKIPISKRTFDTLVTERLIQLNKTYPSLVPFSLNSYPVFSNGTINELVGSKNSSNFILSQLVVYYPEGKRSVQTFFNVTSSKWSEPRENPTELLDSPMVSWNWETEVPDMMYALQDLRAAGYNDTWIQSRVAKWRNDPFYTGEDGQAYYVWQKTLSPNGKYLIQGCTDGETYPVIVPQQSNEMDWLSENITAFERWTQ